MELTQEQIEQWLAILTMNVLVLTAILAEMISEQWEKPKIQQQTQ